MLTKIKKVYYCEYCGKHGLMPLLKHEKHCTANPDRECRLCERRESVRSLIEKYKKQCDVEEIINHKKSKLLNLNYPTFKVINQPNIEDIMDDVDGCPNCTLAIIKGLNIQYPIEFKFDYQKELQQWWQDANDDMSDDY